MAAPLAARREPSRIAEGPEGSWPLRFDRLVQPVLESRCTNCHGPKGDKPLMPNYPKIAGQNAAYAEQQMKDIKSGARNNGQTAAMKGVMHLVSDEEIKALSEYLAKLK